MTAIDPTALMRNALQEIERLQRKLGRLEQQLHEPVAVVGLGCRFAGANSPDDLWRRLLDGADGVRDVPSDRWDVERYFDADPDAAGRIYCRAGSFLDDIASFDASFFGISAREAAMLDPQQRMLLEVVWEAVERAGIPASVLKGTATGMFVGVMHQDYAHRFRGAADVDLYTAAGNAPSVLAGRVSHTLGLHGPSITIDTACSSSLVAVHLACAALRAGECDIAIAGGVNVVLSPLSTAAECRAHMLSPSGRCRSFDDAADGFVRGEGCGVIVLQRLADARAVGRTIEALIAGSAVNHDGRSAGLTVPNEHAQRELVRTALRAARIDPADVQFIEAHGTGTSLGDPIEVAALTSVFAGRAKEAPVLLGSIKSNFGHLEGAAGVAGLIKAVLSVRHGVAPATLHVREPNRRIDWNATPLRLALRNERIDGTRRVAGVSSFGFSGTNAHAVVVSAPPVEAATRRPDTGSHLLTVSARSDVSLRRNAARFAEALSRINASELPDFCHASRVARSHFPHRLAVMAARPDEMAEALGRFARGERAAVETGVCGATPPVRPPEQLSSEDSLPAIARRYIAGEALDWSRLAPEGARIVPLPTYAFDRQRYWCDERVGTGPSPLYRIAWSVTPLPASPRRTGRRIVAGDEPGLCAAVARELEAAGEQCTVVAGNAEDILRAGAADLGVVLVVSGAAASEPVSAIARQGAVVIGLAQALAAQPSVGPVAVVTRRAACAGPAEDVDPVAMAVNAAVRVARREQGQAWRCSIDIDGSEASFGVLAALLGGDVEEDVAVRGTTVLAPRLRRAGAGETMPEAAGDAAYVITGGSGALGLATAGWLAGRGARHLLLISRRGETEPDVRARCDRLRHAGVDVRVASGDVADEASLRRALAMTDRPIRGVIHCAGMIDDATLTTMTAARFEAVLRAKVGGAHLLDRLTADQPLDLFLLFSSLSVAVGRHGQAAYAAANAYLDGLAQRRRLRGRPALSVGWGLWATGMGAGDATTAGRIRATGLHALTEAEAFAGLECAFTGEAHVIVAMIDARRIATQSGLPRLIEGLVGRTGPEQRSNFDIEQLRGQSAEARRTLIAAHLGAELQAILSCAAAPPHDASLLDLGIDSLTAAELRNAIERSTGAAVPVELFIDGSSLQSIVDVVASQVERRLVTTQSRNSATVMEEITL
jgi:acyl transferase domain-containing protein